MLKYYSTTGHAPAVDFETVILAGYAPDGGLYVPEKLPRLSAADLRQWQNYSYQELVFVILSLFIDRQAIPANDLQAIIQRAYTDFTHPETVPLHRLKQRSRETYIMELFHGPTLSFKDVGMALLVSLLDYFLARAGKRQSIVVATTGDTGPAAAHFIAGKSQLDAWVLFPKGMVTPEQERQMTALPHPNVHPVGVFDCPEGGDDLDEVIRQLYADARFKKKLHLSSVNSINWGRVMVQTVHYFYAYFRVAKQVGDPVDFSVPSGGFGNLCGGSLARMMGLPIRTLIAANNENACIHRLFTTGVLAKAPLQTSVSSAIDILVPINFWRHLYYTTKGDHQRIHTWVKAFTETGKVQFPPEVFATFRQGFAAGTVSDATTLKTIGEVYTQTDYLLDPHTAVALAVAELQTTAADKTPLVCLSTAHPAKFPTVIRRALQREVLPPAGFHPSLEAAKRVCQKCLTCHHEDLATALPRAMEADWDFRYD